MNQNGTPKILYWIMGALLSITIAGAAQTILWFNARLIAVEMQASATAREAGETKVRTELLKESLQRMEIKLDKVLEQRTTR